METKGMTMWGRALCGLWIVLFIASACSSGPSGGGDAQTVETVEDGRQTDERGIDTTLPEITQLDSHVVPDSVPPDQVPDDTGADEETALEDWSLPETVVVAPVADFFVTATPGNALAFFAQWSTPQPATSEIQVQCTDGYLIDLSDPSPATLHRAFLMGFADGMECQIAVRSVTDDGPVYQGETSLTAGPLPAFLPELEVVIRKPEKIQEGWNLFNLTNSFDKDPLVIVLVDDQGRYRWYHRRAVNDPGSDTDTRTVPEGVMVGGTHGLIPPAVISWEGNVLWEKPMNVHHDFRPIGDQGHWLMLGDAVGCGLSISSGVVFEYDPKSNSKVWTWLSCEHITPAEWKSDWSHLNTVVVWPDQQHLLVSSRTQDALYKVAYPSGEVLWKLGRDDDFEWEDPQDKFWQQHAPEFLPGGKRILLFDNGMEGVREYGRALELEVDEQAMTVEKVWEFVPEPRIFTPIWGDANRLPNGNTLVTFGARSKVDASHLIEVTDAGEEVWHLIPPLKQGIYRTERVVSPFKGRVWAEDAD